MTRLPAFEHRHVVTYAETNAVGNVYFAAYFLWQGTVRELFLAQHAPEILAAIGTRETLVTVDAHFDFFSELFAFDQVLIRMWAGEPTQNRLRLDFEILRGTCGPDPEIVARGHQTVAWMARTESGPLRPARVPEALRTAIQAARADYERRPLAVAP